MNGSTLRSHQVSPKGSNCAHHGWGAIRPGCNGVARLGHLDPDTKEDPSRPHAGGKTYIESMPQRSWYILIIPSMTLSWLKNMQTDHPNLPQALTWCHQHHCSLPISTWPASNTNSCIADRACIGIPGLGCWFTSKHLKTMLEVHQEQQTSLLPLVCEEVNLSFRCCHVPWDKLSNCVIKTRLVPIEGRCTSSTSI